MAANQQPAFTPIDPDMVQCSTMVAIRQATGSEGMYKSQQVGSVNEEGLAYDGNGDIVLQYFGDEWIRERQEENLLGDNGGTEANPGAIIGGDFWPVPDATELQGRQLAEAIYTRDYTQRAYMRQPRDKRGRLWIDWDSDLQEKHDGEEPDVEILDAEPTAGTGSCSSSPAKTVESKASATASEAEQPSQLSIQQLLSKARGAPKRWGSVVGNEEN